MCWGAGGPEAHGREAGLERGRGRGRPLRVLHVRRVGHPRGPRRQVSTLPLFNP